MGSTQQAESQTLTDQDIRVIDKLFERLKAIFPKWREVWASDGELKAAKQQWTRALVAQGLTDPHLIKLGVDKAQVIGWVRPPAPAQFCLWCIEGAKGQAGIPDKDQAVTQIMQLARKSDYARKRTVMSPAVYHVCRLMDWYEFRRLTVEQAVKATERAYDEMVDHWRAGREFFEQPVMVEHQNPSGVKHTEASRKRGLEIINELKKGL